jgi:hypothetical protein
MVLLVNNGDGNELDALSKLVTLTDVRVLVVTPDADSLAILFEGLLIAAKADAEGHDIPHIQSLAGSVLGTIVVQAKAKRQCKCYINRSRIRTIQKNP